MVKYIIGFITKKNIILILVFFLSLPLALNNTTNIIQSLISSHYITLIANNIYIVYSFNRINYFNDLRNLIIPRISNKNFYMNNIIIGLLSALIYAVLLYATNIVFFGFPPRGYFVFVAGFMFLNLLLYIVVEMVLLQQLGRNPTYIFFILAIVLNFYFHYGIVMPNIFN